MFRTALVSVLLASSAHAELNLSVGARVDATRAVERARYQYVVNATQPFDTVYPRRIFEDRVRAQTELERRLSTRYGVAINDALLENEFRRIEATTQDRDQWDVVKRVLGNNPEMVKEIIARPLVVDRLLRAKFAFDRAIHGPQHQGARQARTQFLGGKKAAGSRRVSVARAVDATASTAEMLEKARSGSGRPPAGLPGKNSTAPAHVSLEVARVLEKELRRPNDVSTILEHPDRFEVYRLVSMTPEAWTVDLVTIPKVAFDNWLNSMRR